MSLHFKTNGLDVSPTSVKHDCFYGDSVTDKKAYRPTSGVAIQLNGVGSPLYDDADDIANHKLEIVSNRGNFDITEIDEKIRKQSERVNADIKEVERKRKKVVDDALREAEIKERLVATNKSQTNTSD